MVCLVVLALLIFSPPIRQVLSAVLSAGDELEAQEMLGSLEQLADVSPLFFRTNVVRHE